MTTALLDRVPQGLAPVDDVTRREFVVGAAAASLLAACGSGSDDKPATTPTTRSITTPLGTYDVPVDPTRVVTIDNRLDLEPALALELPVIAYSLGDVNPWVPVDADAIEIASPVNIEQVAGLRPDLIVCVNTRDEYWLADGLEEIAPVVPTDFEIGWRENIEQLAGWLGRTERLDALLTRYDEAVAGVKERRGPALAEHAIAVVQYDESWGFGMQHSTQYLQPQVIADLGGRLIDPVEGVDEDGTFSLENIEVLEGADAILFVAEPTASIPAALADSPLWHRLPAVAGGRVVVTEGNTNYGSVYTAVKLTEYFDELYAALD